MTVTITIEVNCLEYGLEPSKEAAVKIIAECLRTGTDWPDNAIIKCEDNTLQVEL